MTLSWITLIPELKHTYLKPDCLGSNHRFATSNLNLGNFTYFFYACIFAYELRILIGFLLSHRVAINIKSVDAKHLEQCLAHGKCLIRDNYLEVWTFIDPWEKRYSHKKSVLILENNALK